MDNKAIDEARNAVEETPEWKAYKEAEKALKATPAWKAYRETWGTVGAIPVGKSRKNKGPFGWKAVEAAGNAWENAVWMKEHWGN